MLQDIIYFYKKRLSSYNLIFKHMKLIWYSYWALVIILLFEVIRREGHFNFIANLLCGALLGTASIIVAVCAKKVLKNKYGIGSDTPLWNSYEFEELRKQLLQKYLDEMQLLSENKLSLLISITNREAERKRFKGFVETGVFVVLITALWSPFFSRYITYLNNLQTAFFITLGFTILVVQICIIYLMARFVAVDIINTESKKITNLGRLLENIYFQLPNEIKKES
jgi:hypothetical protein